MFIFDFDGTIANTEDWHWFSWNDALAPFGVILKAAQINKYLAHPDFEIMQMIEHDFGICIADKTAFKNQRLQIFIDKYLKEVVPYPHFLEIYQSVPTQEICVISNQRGDVIGGLFDLCAITGIQIFSASDLKCDKAELIKKQVAKVANVTLYEDSNKYLQLAKELGCKTVGIEHQYNRGSLNAADEVIIY